jgi:hypothetical protein
LHKNKSSKIYNNTSPNLKKPCPWFKIDIIITIPR